jgi:excisionase family DNA binding protein
LTVRDAARALEVSESCVYKLCRARMLGHRRVGVGRGAIRIDRAHLEAYLLAGEVAEEGRPAAEAPAAGARLKAPTLADLRARRL